MALRIQNEPFWDISPGYLLDSRDRFGSRSPVTKFVYQPQEEVLVLGTGREVPSHKALISSACTKYQTDTSHWVRAIILREKKIIYYRQGVQDIDWYNQTTEMLKQYGLPDDYTVRWGLDAKRDLKEDLEGFP